LGRSLQDGKTWRDIEKYQSQKMPDANMLQIAFAYLSAVFLPFRYLRKSAPKSLFFTGVVRPFSPTTHKVYALTHAFGGQRSWCKRGVAMTAQVHQTA
jgi:hypothetical protein